MEIEELKKKNIEYMSDFMFRLAKVTGNGKLSIDKTEKGYNWYFINIQNTTNEFLIYNASDYFMEQVHYGDSRRFERLISTREINTIKQKEEGKRVDRVLHEVKDKYDGFYYERQGHDRCVFEALCNLPQDINKRVGITSDELFKQGINREMEDEAMKQYKQFKILHERDKDKQKEQEEYKQTEEYKKDEKILKLISNVTELTGSTLVNINNGTYYISTPTKDGKYMIYSTTDSKLISENDKVFGVHESKEKIDNEWFTKNNINGIADLDKVANLVKNDANLIEIIDDLQNDLKNRQHTAAEIGEDLQEIARIENKDSALQEIINSENKLETKDNQKEGE